MFKLLGITDEITVCDCCGKPNLKCTIALENEHGETVYFGRDCAGKALYGSKSAKNTKIAESRARMIEACKRMLPIALQAIAAGENADKVVRAVDYRFSVSSGFYSDTGRKMPLRIFFNGWSIPGVEISAENY